MKQNGLSEWAQYHQALDGYNYFLQGREIFRYQMWEKGFKTPGLILSGATPITKEDRPVDKKFTD